tara:strand:- start:915 stop:1442 length:528 start_codon:yes stop_codon:yes gene_type:complete
MKFNYLIKGTPFLSILILIILLTLTNQKQETKLKILIWNTPKLSLGSYVALSAGSGFLFSYFLTTNLVNIQRLKNNKSLKYKVKHEDKQSDESYISSNYDKTLIERDLKDPSPTIKASFRVLGKIDKINSNLADNSDLQNYIDNDLYHEIENHDDIYSDEKSDSADWNDKTFLSW